MPHDPTDQRTVPASALCFAAGPLEFVAGDAGGDDKKVPIRLLARTGQPVKHPFWGRVVHDLDAMQHKPTIAIDYVHDDREVIGYADQFNTETGDLVLKGALTPFTGDDRASEIIHKVKLGVPFGASIAFGGAPVRVEELDEGQTAEVNGYTFEGPGTIIREWTLRGVAVCPRGADPNTRTQLHGKQSEFQVTVVRQTPQVPEPSDATADQDPDAKGPEVNEGRDWQEFVDAFGDRGAMWYCEGKTFAEATEIHLREKVAALEKRGTELSAKIEAMGKRLAGVDDQDEFPPGFQGADRSRFRTAGDEEDSLRARREETLRPAVGDNLAKFAAGIKFPNRNGQA